MNKGVAVTARRANGEVFRMGRREDPLPFFFQHMEFTGGDEAHLDEYLVQLHDHVLRTPEGDILDQGMVVHNKLAPYGHGCVVIDYQTKTVLSLQTAAPLISAPRFNPLLPPGRARPPKGWVDVTTWEENGAAVAHFEHTPLFRPETSPWEFLQFPVTPEGMAAFRKYLVEEMGFRLMPDEESLWDNYARQGEVRC